MSKLIHICTDRWLPGSAPFDYLEADGSARLAIDTGRLWEPGQTLRVSFMDGHPAVHERVRFYARQWTEHANIHLDFCSDPAAEIRVAFNADDGSWSYIGVDALDIASGQPTMNLGWLTPESDEAECARVVLHEFGHALGCIHEHQSPAAAIPWNEEAVYEFFGGEPNCWSREEVYANIFLLYQHSHMRASVFDPLSIMLYAIPPELTQGGYTVGWNSALSEQDKLFIAEAYPFD